jgi:FAD/FMN-containing dehydrogenase
MKRGFLPREVENGAPLFARLKRCFDPEGLMNPGKLWGSP